MSVWTKKEDTYTSGLYAKHPLALARGEGARLWDPAGREYIDCMAGHGVANLGHAHPAVVAAITAQAGQIITCPETYYNETRAALMERLVGLAPGAERVFFCNSGAEAVEAALKFARLATGRTDIVATMRGFHGRTFGALSATWNKHYREPFEPLTPGFQFAPYNNLAALEALVTEETAAVILEVIQGEGGVYVGDRDYLRGVQALCRARGALLIIDEVQTGLGRTGKLFACEHDDLTPDLLCLAKSLAGGVPIGATLLGPRVHNLSPGKHGSTFGGNPLACAAALATLEVLQRDDLPAQAAAKGAYFMERLRALDAPAVREVRGRGLLIGIELKRKSAPYLQALENRGVLALPAGLTVIRLLPPLVIEYEQIDQVIVALAEVLQ